MFSHFSLDVSSLSLNLSTNAIWLLGIGLVVSWYILSSIYTWYRLRKFPVPSYTAAFSYFWLAKTTFSGKQYWVQRELHKQRGPLVRIGPNELLTDDPEVLRKISHARSGYKRGAWYQTGRFNPYHENLLSLREPAPHAKAKARTASAYSGREMEEGVEPGINEQLQTLIDILGQTYIADSERNEVQPLLDLAPISTYFTLDVITRLAFGKAFGYLSDQKDHYNFMGSLRMLWPIMSTSAGIPWVRGVLCSKLFLRIFGPKTTDKNGFGADEVSSSTKNNDQHPLTQNRPAEENVSQRFAQKTQNESDMLSSLMRHGLTREECEAEGLLMIISGADSTSSAIRSTLIHTITTPRVYQTLKQEIKLAVSEGRASNPITYEEAKRLPYLQAVMYEGIRMRPPLLGLFPKVVPEGGDNIHGKFIPAGTWICMNLSSLLCSTTLFGADADIFAPERFIKDRPGTMEMKRNVELAFGYGQWACVGKTLALWS